MPEQNNDTQNTQTTQTSQTAQTAQTPNKEGYMGTQEEKTYEIKVDGQVQKVTLQEALKAAEKVGGADARFREAKQVEPQARTMYRRILDGVASEQEINRFADLMELTPEERQFLLPGEEPDTQTQQTQQTADATSGKKGKKEEPDVMSLLSKEDKEALEYARMARKTEQERVFKENVLGAIDKASNISDIKGRIPEESWNDFKQDLYERCRSEVLVRLQVPGTKYGPELLNRVLESEINRIKKYGTLFQKKEQPVNLGLGSSGSMDFQALVQDDKPVERVAGSDPNYAENFAKRVAQRFLKLGR